MRISQPASGNCFSAVGDERLRGAVASHRCRAVARDNASARGCRAAPGRWRASLASLIRRRGPKPMPPASLSGSLRKHGADFERRGADRDAVAGLQIEPHQQAPDRPRAPKTPSRSAKRIGERHGRFEHGRADQRIGIVDRLDLDQRHLVGRQRAPSRAWWRRRRPVRGFAGMRARRRSPRDGSARTTTSPPRMVRPSRARPPVRLSENEPTPAIAITPSAMQRDQDIETANAAAQFAQRKTQRQRAAMPRGGETLMRRDAHARTAAR